MAGFQVSISGRFWVSTEGIDDLQRVLTEERIGARVEAVVLRDGSRRVAYVVATEIRRRR